MAAADGEAAEFIVNRPAANVWLTVYFTLDSLVLSGDSANHLLCYINHCWSLLPPNLVCIDQCLSNRNVNILVTAELPRKGQSN